MKIRPDIETKIKNALLPDEQVVLALEKEIEELRKEEATEMSKYLIPEKDAPHDNSYYLAVPKGAGLYAKEADRAAISEIESKYSGKIKDLEIKISKLEGKNDSGLDTSKIETTENNEEAEKLNAQENDALKVGDGTKVEETEKEIDKKVVKNRKGSKVDLNKEAVNKIKRNINKATINIKAVNVKIKEFVAEGYSPEDAKERATYEEMISCSEQRKILLTEYLNLENPTGIENAEKRIGDAEKAILANEKALDTLKKKYDTAPKTPARGVNRKIQDAQNEYDLIVKNDADIKLTADSLIPSGYSPADALEIAELMDLINNDEKKAKILTENPKMNRAPAKLKKLIKSLEENKEKLQKMMEERLNVNPSTPDTNPAAPENKKTSWFSSKVAWIKNVFSKKNKDDAPTEPAVNPDVNTTEPTAQEKSNDSYKFSMITGWFKSGKKNTPATPEPGVNPDAPATPGATIERIELERRLALIEQNRAEKLESSKYKKSIISGLNSWGNNWEGEKGKVVYAKKIFKTVVNLSLVMGISMGGVEGLAKLGAGTATAVTSSAIASRFGFGLGIGAVMNLNLPPVVKKWLPKVIMGGMVGLAFASGAGGIALASAGAGLLASRIKIERYTDKNIEERQKKATEKLLEKYNNGTTDKDIAAIEKEYEKLLKHYENSKIWGKLAAEGAKVMTGAVVSGVMLEASGAMQDHATSDAKIEAAHAKAEAELKREIVETNAKAEHLKTELEHAKAEAEAQLKAEHDKFVEHEKAEAAHLKADAEHAKAEAIEKAEHEKLDAAKISQEKTTGNTETGKTDGGATTAKAENGNGEIKINGHVEPGIGAPSAENGNGEININGHVEPGIGAPSAENGNGEININGHVEPGIGAPSAEISDADMQAKLDAQLDAQVEAEFKAELEGTSPNITASVEPEHTAAYNAEHQLELRHEAETQIREQYESQQINNPSLQDDQPSDFSPAEHSVEIEAKYQELLHNEQAEIETQHQLELRNEAETQIREQYESQQVNTPSMNDDSASHFSPTEHSEEIEAKYQELLHTEQINAEAQHELELKHEADLLKAETERLETAKAEAEHAKHEQEDLQKAELRNEIKLTSETKEQYERIEEKMFPNERSLNAWDKIKDSTTGQSAEKLLNFKLEETNEVYRPLISLIHQLHEITGIEPRGETLLGGPAESGKEYIMEGIKEAIKMGKIDDLKL